MSSFIIFRLLFYDFSMLKKDAPLHLIIKQRFSGKFLFLLSFILLSLFLRHFSLPMWMLEKERSIRDGEMASMIIISTHESDIIMLYYSRFHLSVSVDNFYASHLGIWSTYDEVRMEKENHKMLQISFENVFKQLTNKPKLFN